MSSPTTSPQTGGSTSPRPATAPTPTKIAVRARPPALSAVKLAQATTIRLSDGRDIPAQPGDWLIAHDKTVVDVVSDRGLDARYQKIEPGSLRLPAAACEQIERTTGLGSTRSSEDLVAAVERLAAIEIGSVRIDFTPGQLEELRLRALKRGRSVQLEIKAVVDRIREEIFWRN